MSIALKPFIKWVILVLLLPMEWYLWYLKWGEVQSEGTERVSQQRFEREERGDVMGSKNPPRKYAAWHLLD